MKIYRIVFVVINILSIVVLALPEAKSVIDIHSHVGCLGYKSDCYVNPGMKNSFKLPFYLKAFGVTEFQLRQQGDGLVAEKIDALIESSTYIDKVVLIALDGAVQDVQIELPSSLLQSKQDLNLDRTVFYIPNDHIFKLVKTYKHFLYGASINPKRANSVKLLERASQDGAVLVKLLPNIMDINLADESFIPFYKKLVELNMPLLVHTGNENSFNRSDDDLGNPSNLELPLKLGVKVIAAHMASLGHDGRGASHFESFINLSTQYKNLYSDCSALTDYNRTNYLARSSVLETVQKKTLYGTDFPLINIKLVSSPFYHIPLLNIRTAIEISSIMNPYDRDIILKSYLGFKDEGYRLTRDFLRINR